MAFEYVKLGIALVFVTTLCGLATAQSGCTSALLGLAPCLNYITGNSTTPASSCCSQLSSVVQSQPQCLCSALNGGGSSFGITINQTKALSLPGACNVQTPPVSRCNGASGQAAAPLSSALSPAADTVSSAVSPAAATVSSAVSPAAAQVSSAVSPAAAPVSSAVSPTADSSDETPDTPAASSMPSIPAGTGSKTVPTKEGSEANGSSKKMPIALTLFTLFVASYI
ncbi:hypothetical protein HRI_000604600 [Hibiscus trionum]|uniref:Bifunctional inhibitor/plant lipid transfer protein/seed storage helical domain-containing protein n=1 Tax=Hibiscus trionum TaxID=183268 RepID=A0A9W7H2Q8_HIBTR|nr:hypothetical protein HRI_000604600 [Hibiscus trionum]